MQLGQCSFSGMPNFFARVFYGVDPQLEQNLLKEIKSKLPEGDLKNNFDDNFKIAFQNALAPLVAAGYKDLPIREAIDFVYSYLHITVKAFKFVFGAPRCGGPIEVGFITTDRKYRWAVHKTFTTAIEEQKGGYLIEQ